MAYVIHPRMLWKLKKKPFEIDRGIWFDAHIRKLPFSRFRLNLIISKCSKIKWIRPRRARSPSIFFKLNWLFWKPTISVESFRFICSLNLCINVFRGGPPPVPFTENWVFNDFRIFGPPFAKANLFWYANFNIIDFKGEQSWLKMHTFYQPGALRPNTGDFR